MAEPMGRDDRAADDLGPAVAPPHGPGAIRTVGHSTRTLDELIDVVRPAYVTELVDVRTVPRSRHNPQYNRDTLPDALAARGVGYLPLPELGGLRRPRPDSPNGGWRNASFRGFADYMATEEFSQGLAHLLSEARHRTVAIMCAEAVPWRCHRSLIADALVVRGVEVIHLLSPTRSQAHRRTPWARVDGTRLSYRPPADPSTVLGTTSEP
ncbi:MAG: DUF488 family protein [Thermoplasmata archaeon]